VYIEELAFDNNESSNLASRAAGAGRHG